MSPAALEAHAEWHAWQDIYDRLARIEDRLTPAERREKADAERKAAAAYRRYARLRDARDEIARLSALVGSGYGAHLPAVIASTPPETEAPVLSMADVYPKPKEP